MMSEEFSIIDVEDDIMSVKERLKIVALLLDNYFHITDEDSEFDHVNSMRFIELLSEQVHEASERLGVVAHKSASLRLRGKKEPVAD